MTGAYLVSVYLSLPFYFGALMALAGFVFLAFYVEEKHQKIDFSIKRNFIKMKNIAKDSINYSLGHKVIFWLLLGGIISTLVFQPLNMFWSIRFNNMLGGDRLWLLGWIWAAMSIFMIAGAYSVKHLLKRGKDYTSLMIIVSLGVFLPIILSSIGHTFLLAFPPFLIYQLVKGIERPVNQAFLNKYADSEKRATIISFESMISCLGAAGGLVFFGWIAKNSSIETSWIMAAILALGLIPIYLMARKKEKHYDILPNS